jgi:hypothetical protein
VTVSSPRPRVTRRSGLVAVTWAALVAVALLYTLDNLSKHDFDGLNNMFQIPLALPWFLIPIGGMWSDQTDAWIAAAMGWVNAVIILLFADVWLDSHRAKTDHPD